MSNRNFDLKKLQRTQIEIFKEVDRICKKYDIQYFGTWGTTLGAIRHGGFIPWDDDIDISMKWKEFKKFEEACKVELDEKYFLQNTESDKYYWQPYSKIRLNNTTSMDMDLTHMKCHYGICIDIFPINPIPNSKILRIKQSTLINIYKLLCYIPYILYTNPNDKTYKGKIIRVIPKTIISFLKKFLIGNKKLNKLRNSITESINKYDIDKCDYCGETMVGPSNIGVYKNEIFKEAIEVNFEDVKMPIPKEYHQYLKLVYGEYMELPKEEDRIGHGDTIVDFENSYEKYQTEI